MHTNSQPEQRQLNVLLVEDTEDDAQILQRMLRKSYSGALNLVRATDLVQARELLVAVAQTEMNDLLAGTGGASTGERDDPVEEHNNEYDNEYDAILLDLWLPESSGLETLRSVQSWCGFVPIIVLSGLNDEETMLNAMRAGAQDYIVKETVKPDMLLRTIRYAVERSQTQKELRTLNRELDRRVAERARQLLESEEQFRNAFEYAAIGMALVGLDGRWLRVNRALCEIVGYSEQELLATSFQSITHPDDLEADLANIDRLLAGDFLSYTMEKRYYHRLGHEVCILLSVSLVKGMEGEPMHFVSQIQDITERKRIEAALEEYAVSWQDMLHRSMTAQEAERRRLSREIHDGPLQSLGVSLLALDRARMRYARGEHEGAITELNTLRTQLAATVHEVRDVLGDLSLDVLTTHGLLVALNGYTERYTDITGIKVAIETTLDKRLPPELELLAYRLTQEALSNIYKHAEAHNATVTLDVRGDALYVSISDGGKGFDPSAVLVRRDARHGLGLRSMRERVELAGGQLQVNSELGSGTTITALCPVIPFAPTRRPLGEYAAKEGAGRTTGSS